MKITHNVIFEGKTHTVLSKAERYVIGRLPPNFPVPAIPLAVTWQESDFWDGPSVAIKACNNPITGPRQVYFWD